MHGLKFANVIGLRSVVVRRENDIYDVMNQLGAALIPSERWNKLQDSLNPMIR
jgi:hypothetical protein